MKIDESLRMCQDNETLIQKLGRFDDETYQQAKLFKLDDKTLKEKMQELLVELEKFPRKNRHSTDWYNKYHDKFLDLQLQADSVEQTEIGIKDLLKQLNGQKQKALEENFLKLNSLFEKVFKRIVP